MKQSLSGEEWINSSKKRRRDIALTVALLGPASALIAVSSAALYIEKPIKPWFRQVRVGRDGELFDISKLRTMTSTQFYDAGNGPHDNRRTPVGKLLGIAGIDELPQLFNVLGGDMSIVGPRPLPTVVVDVMRDVLSESEFNEWYRAYTIPRPGLVSEFSNLSRNLDPQSDQFLLKRAELDVAYLEQASSSFDTKIILESCTLAVGRTATLLSHDSPAA